MKQRKKIVLIASMIGISYPSFSQTFYQCITCPNGTYSVNNECKTCPKGSYCYGGQKYLCNAGTYNPYTGAGSVYSCKNCPVGHYCPADGASSTIMAPKNTYVEVEGQSRYLPCPNGTWSNPGSISCSKQYNNNEIVFQETTPGNYEITLGSGIYKIELIGGGGGGASTDFFNYSNFYSNTHYEYDDMLLCPGKPGEYHTEHVTLIEPTVVKMSIGYGKISADRDGSQCYSSDGYSSCIQRTQLKPTSTIVSINNKIFTAISGDNGYVNKCDSIENDCSYFAGCGGDGRFVPAHSLNPTLFSGQGRNGGVKITYIAN